MKILSRPVSVVSLWLTLSGVLFAGERAEKLKAALAGADRVTVASVEERDGFKPVEIKDQKAIAVLTGQLEFDDRQSGFHCMCDGDTAVTFYKGESKLAEISHHHGRSLRWDGGKWKGDSLFTLAAAQAWRAWFKDHGEERFEVMYQQRVKAAKLAQEEFDNFVKELPAGAAQIFMDADDGMRTFSPDDEDGNGKKALSPGAKKLKALFTDPAKLAVAVSRALGTLDASGNGSWSMSTAREQLVIECVHTLDGSAFLSGLTAGGADRIFLLGAARVFFFEGMGRQLPAEKGAEWAARLCEAVLTHDHCGNAGMALRALEDFHGQPVTGLLVKVASGTLKVPSEKDSDDPGAQASACLSLAKAGHAGTKELVTKLLARGTLPEMDAAAFLIARSLLGERKLLSADIFKIDSYTIGYGALAALEKEGGRAAVDAVVNGGLEHGYAAVSMEAVLTVERMTGQKWFQNGKNERPDWHIQKVKKWWSANRESYPVEKPAAKPKRD